MAECNLKIELDDPNRTRVGGENVTGTVLVSTSGPMQCKGLEVTSYWATHGRGNVETGDVDRQELFQGQWETGREYRYPFTVKTTTWPPTYYGTLLNVSHGVRVRARVPWSKDPTTQVEYALVANSPPEDLKPPAPLVKPSRSIIGATLGFIIGGILIVLVLSLLSVALLLLLIPLAIGGAGWWFVRVFLPRQLTGSIECTVEPKRATAGETIRGQLRFTPRRNMHINTILWTVNCAEKCVSGSGSDRKTFDHEILNHIERLSESGELRVGEPQLFEFSFQVPQNAPPSLKFTDNSLNWNAELRIDIARWPDWVQKIPLTIVASAQQESDAAIPQDATPQPSAGEDWFYEVLRQLEKFQDDPANLRTVLDAVRDQVFAVRADITESLDEAPPIALGESGVWRLAIPRRTDVELALVWPLPNAAPAPESLNWSGNATILGYDSHLDCLVMRVVPAT